MSLNYNQMKISTNQVVSFYCAKEREVNSIKSVISGIKSHRVDTEKELARVNKEIEDKAVIARQYGISVDDSKSVIASLEEEIHGFENDLVELSDKFKNFKELLATGNKEISNKILEKRTLISKETRS